MNKKGFTLIELLAVIIIIGLLAVLITPSILTAVNKSREVSYNTLIKNIVTSSQMYYEECEYGDLSDKVKYDIYACEINNNNTITTTLGALANTGFLKVNETKEENDKEVKVVLDPRDNSDKSSCQIKIIKKVDSSFKVTYEITGTGTNCPTTDEYKGAA